MKSITLPRTGQPNVKFVGEHIASAQSPQFRWHMEEPQATAHWFQIEVYRTEGGSLVAWVAYRFHGKKLHREVQRDAVVSSAFSALNNESPEELLLEELESLHVSQWLKGYPAGDKWIDKQKNLQTGLVADYTALLADVKDKLLKLVPAERME